MHPEADSTAPSPGEEPGALLLRRILEAGGPAIAVGRQSPLVAVLRDLSILSATRAPAVFWGEPGSGRRTLARALHALSGRADQPWVRLRAVDDGRPAAPAALSIEHDGKRPRTDLAAFSDLPHLLSSADAGTLLLEGLTGIPPLVQEQLVGLLDRLHAVGEVADELPRVLAICDEEPLTLVEDGDLSEELYYRLGVFVLAVPALRERESDIVAIAQHVVRQANGLHRLSVRGLDEPTLERLRQAPWPGNVPELRRTVEHAAIRARSGWIRPHHLPREMGGPDSASPPARLVLSVGITAADAERRLILATLEQTGFNKTEAARRLGMDVKTVRNKLKSYDLSERNRRRRDRSSSPGRKH